MAVSTGYDFGIRDNLVKNGVNSADIGFDKGTGFVTVKGVNAIKAPKNYMGTSYTSQNDFNSDWSNFQKTLQQPQPVVKPTEVTAQSVTTQTTPTPPADPLKDLLAALLKQAQTPTPVDVNSIYSSPQWAASQAQAQRGADQGIRAAQESLGSAGFGRSTVLGERAQVAQNDANQYLQTQVLPQLMAAAQQEQQQKFQNQTSVLDTLMRQKDSADRLAIDKGTLTGNYLDPEAARLIDEITSLGEAWKTGTPEQRAQFSQQADNNRAKLSAMGIDPSQFGADKTTEQRIANAGKVGVRTLGGQNQDLAVENQAFNQGIDMATLTGYLPDGTPTTAQQATELANLWKVAEQTGVIPDVLASLYGIPPGTPTRDAYEFAQNLALDKQQVGISQQNANTSSASQSNAAGNANFNKLMDVWAATGKAPDGLQAYGIQPDAAYKPDSGKPVPYDQTPEWAQEIAALNSDPEGTYDDLLKNSNDYISQYTYDGYQKLLSQAKSIIDFQ